MPNIFPDNKKRFYDFTKQDYRDRMDDLEAEVERLSNALTVLIYRRKTCSK